MDVNASPLLVATVVAPTLDEPLTEGKNTIWCASFLAAWKVLQDEVLHGPVQLAGAEGSCEKLNRAADPRKDIPEASIYAAGGLVEDGVIPKIQRAVSTQFPSIDPPAFPSLDGRALVVYSILKASARFRIPYCQNNEPLEFSDSRGVKVNVRSFGVPRERGDAFLELRTTQPQVVYASFDDGQLSQWVVDLDRTSKPNQVLVAFMKPKATLSDTVASAECRLRQQADGSGGLYPMDVLLVPELALRIRHRFAQLEGRPTCTPGLSGVRIDVAEQDIEFNLNRSGAELKSQVRMQTIGGPRHFVLDRPFLTWMRKRGAARPYFAMWVDNAEMLERFGP